MGRFIKVNNTFVNVESITMVRRSGKDATEIFWENEPSLIVNNKFSEVRDMLIGADAQCKKCVHYIDVDDGEGICTRYPPRVEGTNSVFPKVLNGFNCGEYQGELND
jgi:hypothetical protein